MNIGSAGKVVGQVVDKGKTVLTTAKGKVAAAASGGGVIGGIASVGSKLWNTGANVALQIKHMLGDTGGKVLDALTTYLYHKEVMDKLQEMQTYNEYMFESDEDTEDDYDDQLDDLSDQKSDAIDEYEDLRKTEKELYAKINEDSIRIGEKNKLENRLAEAKIDSTKIGSRLIEAQLNASDNSIRGSNDAAKMSEMNNNMLAEINERQKIRDELESQYEESLDDQLEAETNLNDFNADQELKQSLWQRFNDLKGVKKSKELGSALIEKLGRATNRVKDKFREYRDRRREYKERMKEEQSDNELGFLGKVTASMYLLPLYLHTMASVVGAATDPILKALGLYDYTKGAGDGTDHEDTATDEQIQTAENRGRLLNEDELSEEQKEVREAQRDKRKADKRWKLLSEGTLSSKGIDGAIEEMGGDKDFATAQISEIAFSGITGVATGGLDLLAGILSKETSSIVRDSRNELITECVAFNNALASAEGATVQDFQPFINVVLRIVRAGTKFESDADGKRLKLVAGIILNRVVKNAAEIRTQHKSLKPILYSGEDAKKNLKGLWYLRKLTVFNLLYLLDLDNNIVEAADLKDENLKLYAEKKGIKITGSKDENGDWNALIGNDNPTPPAPPASTQSTTSEPTQTQASQVESTQSDDESDVVDKLKKSDYDKLKTATKMTALQDGRAINEGYDKAIEKSNELPWYPSVTAGYYERKKTKGSKSNTHQEGRAVDLQIPQAKSKNKHDPERVRGGVLLADAIRHTPEAKGKYDYFIHDAGQGYHLHIQKNNSTAKIDHITAEYPKNSNVAIDDKSKNFSTKSGGSGVVTPTSEIKNPVPEIGDPGTDGNDNTEILINRMNQLEINLTKIVSAVGSKVTSEGSKDYSIYMSSPRRSIAWQ